MKPTSAAALVALLFALFFTLGGGTAATAAFPGGNGRIAYASNQSGSWDIYTMNADGSDQVRLTSDPGDSTQPSFSADGNRIAFASNRDGSYDIYAMNADGSGVVRLTTDPGVDTQPTFSPDGSRIAFIGKRETSWYGHVYLMNADGSDQVRLINQFGSEERPAFSLDGSRIAFGSVAQKHKQIFTMTPAGAEMTALTHGAFDNRQPAYSPDGRRIAFASRREGQSAIFTMRSDGDAVTRLVSRTPSQMPAYAPDGDKIAFASGGDIFVMSASGSGEVRLTREPTTQAWPSWQPLTSATVFGPKGPHQGGGHANRLRIGKPILDRRHGTARLPVTVPAAGTLSLRGKQVRSPARRSLAGPATVKLLIKPKAGATRALARKGRARVKVLVSFALKGGSTEVETKSFSLRKRNLESRQ